MAASPIRETIAPVRTAGYAFLASTLVLQMLDFVLVGYPTHFGQATWRFNAYGSLSSTVGNLLLLLLIMNVFALVLEDRKVVLFIGTLTGVMAVVFLLVTAGFVLDAIQLRSGLQGSQLSAFNILWLAAVLKILTMTVVCALFTTASLRFWRRSKPSEDRSQRPERGDDLIMGRTPGGRASAS